MNMFLRDHLVCPRTKAPLTWYDDHLVSSSGYSYPIRDGIPVMLVDEIEPTNPVRFENTQQQITDPLSIPPDPSLLGADDIDPYVREHISATCGRLYRSVGKRLHRYPIPDICLPLGEGRCLLDIGCGWGRWSIAAARKGYQTIGIDPSIDRARAARRISQQLGVAATFVVGDARCLPFSAECFDVVFSYSVLQSFSRADVRTGLSEIKHVLRQPHGLSCIQMATRWGLHNIANQVKKQFRKPAPFMVQYWSQRDLHETFTKYIGPTKIKVDGFFSVNPQMTDLDILPLRYRMVVRVSNKLRHLSDRKPSLIHLADSVYIYSHLASQNERQVD